MLPLKPFALCEPKNFAELKAILATMDDHTKLMAGGTDLLPNLKHGLYDVNRIISLKRVSELKACEIKEGRITLNAMVKLNDIARNLQIQRAVPALAKAASLIASPQIRHMGTVGGNICLDTRCLYFNQTEFWRHALGFCLKKDGLACHVVKTGKRCVAAASNDLATVLLAYGARITIESPHESINMKLDDFYTPNGEKNNLLTHGQFVSSAIIDVDSAWFGGFYKVRMRESIDFSMLSSAVAFKLDDRRHFKNGRLVLNALVAKPKVLDLAQFDGLLYNQALIDTIAQFAHKKCHPQTNIGGEVEFRKHMVAIAVKRAFHDALECMV